MTRSTSPKRKQRKSKRRSARPASSSALNALKGNVHPLLAFKVVKVEGPQAVIDRWTPDIGAIFLHTDLFEDGVHYVQHWYGTYDPLQERAQHSCTRCHGGPRTVIDNRKAPGAA